MEGRRYGNSARSAHRLHPYMLTPPQCGHLSGKVVVPTSAHISRLVASRFQLDLLQNTMLLIARTDAESARLLSSTVDARDHPYIRGVSTRSPDGSRRLALAEVLDRAEAEGRSGAEIDDLEAKWLSEVKLITFDEGNVDSFWGWGWGGCSPRADALGLCVTYDYHQRSNKRFRGRATSPSTRRHLLSGVIGRQLPESQTLRRGTLLQALLVPKSTGTGIVRPPTSFSFTFHFNCEHSTAHPRRVLPYCRWY